MYKFLVVFASLLFIQTVRSTAQCPATTTPSGTFTSCGGAPAFFTASSGTSYQWLSGAVPFRYPIAGATNQTYTAPGLTATVSVIVYNGSCFDTSAVTSCMGSMGYPIYSVTPSNVAIVAGQSVAVCVPDESWVTRQWRLNGADIPGATAACYNATAPGTYSVFAKNGQCTAVTMSNAVVSVFPTSVAADGGILTNAVIMPNPSFSEASLQLTVAKTTTLHVMVTDMFGRPTWNEQVTCDPGTQQVALPASLLATGVYQVVVKNKDGAMLQTLKWMKE